MDHRRIALRLAAYLWAAPNTALGGLAGLVMLCLGGRVHRVDGVAEFHDGLVGRFLFRLPGGFRIRAITFGHVVLGANLADLKVVRGHEHVHVRQYERWGPLFLPAYVLSSLWQLIRGRRMYRDNAFERAAYAADAARDGAVRAGRGRGAAS